jgi:hypothetical protein
VGPRAGLDGYGKSRLHGGSNPGLSSPLRFAILTTRTVKYVEGHFSATLQQGNLFIRVLNRNVLKT